MVVVQVVIIGSSSVILIYVREKVKNCEIYFEVIVLFLFGGVGRESRRGIQLVFFGGWGIEVNYEFVGCSFDYCEVLLRFFCCIFVLIFCRNLWIVVI